MLLDKTFVHRNQIYRRDAAGNLYVWQPNVNGLGELGGWWKKVTNTVKKIHREVIRIAKQPIQLEKKLRVEILKSKYGRAVVTGAGAVFAPFTGGASLAAAQALTRYGKARYGQGLSRSDAYKKGAVGGVVGYVAGVGLVYGAGQVGIGRAATQGLSPSFFTPFGTAAAPLASAAAPSASLYANAYSGLTQAAPLAQSAAGATSWLTTIASAAKTATAWLPIVSAFMPKAQQGAPGGENFDPGMLSTGAPFPGAFSNDYGGGGGGGGGGGPNMPPEIDPETGEPVEAGLSTMPPALIAAALGGLVLFTTMGGGRRSRKHSRRGRK